MRTSEVVAWISQEEQWTGAWLHSHLAGRRAVDKMSGERRDADLTRRTLLRSAAGVGAAAAASLFPACRSGGKSTTDGDGPPETTTIRLNKNPLSCFAAAATAGDFLKQEGFTDVQYLQIGLPEQFSALASGVFDMHMYPAQLAAARIDAGDPIVVLGGIHVGCWQVFGTEAIKSMSDFRGKTMATGGPQAPDHVLLATTLANVGIDIRRDVQIVTHSPVDAVRVLAAGQVDGIMALPPFSTRMREQRIGHVVVDSTMDRPWSQYYCCMLAVNRTFMTANPIATKRALRAFLKAADVIAVDPERGARRMVDLGMADEKSYQGVVDDLRMMPFNVWRHYDPVDTLSFYSLRLKEAGLVSGTPEQVISRGTDFRYFRTLRQEMRAS